MEQRFETVARSGCTGDPMQDSQPIAAVGLDEGRRFESCLFLFTLKEPTVQLDLWLGFTGFVLAIIFHCYLTWRWERRALEKQALLQKQLEMFREGCALIRYGARDEGMKMIEDALDLGQR